MPRGTERLLGAAPPGLSHGAGQRGVPHDSTQRRLHRLRPLVVHEESGAAVDDRLRQGAQPGCDHGAARRHRLERRPAGLVRARGHQHEDVESLEHGRKIGVTVAGEQDPGTEGSLVADNAGRYLRWRGRGGPRARVFLRDRRGLGAQLAEFVAAVRDGRPPALPARAARVDLAVVVAAYRSLETGQAVELSDDEGGTDDAGE